MNREERERLVNGVLDRALGPQPVEPRPGLENRILANLPAALERRPWWQWMWIPALAAAAVLAIVIGMRVMHEETPPPVQAKKTVTKPKEETAKRAESAVNKQPVPVIAMHTPRRRTVSAPKVEIARATPSQELPRQAVFPAPLPLTEQERLLLAFVNRQRPQAELVASEQQAEREKVQKYFETGEAPVAPPTPAQTMR